MAITAVLSYYFCRIVDAYFKHPADLVSGLWCVLASIIVLQNNIGGTYKAIWKRFLGVLLGSIIGTLFAFGIGAEIESLGLAIVVTVILCSVLGIQDSNRIAALSVAIIMIPWKSHSEGVPWVYAFFRFFDTCLGFLVSIGVSHLIWPSQAAMKIRTQMSELFVLFRHFFDHTLAGYSDDSKQDFICNALKLEIENALIDNRMILEELEVEVLFQNSTHDIWINLLNCQDRLWENLRTIGEKFNPHLLSIFDKSLKTEFDGIVDGIDRSLQALSCKLKEPETNFDSTLLHELQESLTLELTRFRATHAIKRYHLETVENYYVFFYQLRQVLIVLETFAQNLARLETAPDVK